MSIIDLHAERDAFVWMQGRLIELLLRHDTERFVRSFGEQQATGHPDARLERYRELAVLIYLRDELFQSILPRIKRRLSFAAPRELRTEEMPARGRVDWTRTISTSMRTLPGEPPLQVQTRQRRRHFATPENVLVVATLLEYQAKVHAILATETALGRAQALQHPLTHILDACTRELVFPQFASLVDEAAEIVEQRTTQSIEELEHRVAANLLPGHNSAYNDLLVWRQKLASLQLPDRPQESPDDMMLGASAEEVDYLYQIWLFYELVDLIQRRGGLIRWQPQQGSLTFRWGQGEQQPTYVLRHDRAIPQHWRNAPGVRPDLYIAHVDRYEVRDGNALIWHEPGFVLDAKYYKPRDSSRAPSSTVKRMIADLHLTGERYGALLFAFQRGSAAGEVWDTTAPEPTEYEPTVSLPDSSNTPLYRVTPQGPAAQRGAPDEMIAIWRISPRLGGEANTEQILEAILDEAHAALQNRLTPKCHGIFADSLSITAEASLHERFGSDLSLVPGDILICPKPHVGTWRTDIVSRSRHCCSDARLCHIVGQPDAQKPVRQPRDINDLLTELDQILGEAGQDTLDEYGEAAAAVAERIQRVTRAFAEFAQVDFEFYYNRLRDLGMSQTLGMLGTVERESLALSEFLKDQLDRIKASDFSAPAIHVSSVIEVELKRRVFQCPDLVGDLVNPKKQTLGVLPYLRRSDDPDGNWQRIQGYVALHWDEHPDPYDADRCIPFEDLITKAINRIAQLRNIAAHTNPLSRREYTELQGMIFQGGKLGFSALNALLLGWKG